MPTLKYVPWRVVSVHCSSILVAQVTYSASVGSPLVKLNASICRVGQRSSMYHKREGKEDEEEGHDTRVHLERQGGGSPERRKRGVNSAEIAWRFILFTYSLV